MKRFWEILKKVFFYTFCVAVVGSFLFVLISGIQKQKQLNCSGLQIQIDYESGNSWVNEAEIKSKLEHLCGRELNGRSIVSFDLKTMERELEKNPYVQNAELFFDQKQQLHVNIVQKKALLRVINTDAVSYYISENNEVMPICPNFTPHVFIAMGNIRKISSDKRNESMQLSLFDLTKALQRDSVMNAITDQIWVNDNDEFELITRFGSHSVLLGKNEELEKKFEKLKIFYRKALTKAGWNKYQQINLKYDHQVVALKRDSL